jgi:hypothetical protein
MLRQQSDNSVATLGERQQWPGEGSECSVCFYGSSGKSHGVLLLLIDTALLLQMAGCGSVKVPDVLHQATASFAAYKKRTWLM